MAEAEGGYPKGEAASPPTAPPTSGASSKVSPRALELWDKDLGVVQEAIKCLLMNKTAEAEALLDGAIQECAARTIDFKSGEHDMRGIFAYVNAILSFMHGLASLQKDQLDSMAERVEKANELILLDGEWAGKTVMRGMSLLLDGVVKIAQGSYSVGVWRILRSWLFLRTLESEAMVYQGHESSVVRSTALLALGVFNLMVSMLPPTAMKAAGWLTGFAGGRETAFERLRLCWEERGLQAPFAGMILIGASVDLSSFLGEFGEQRKKRHADARMVLDWAAEAYPSSFFYDGLDSTYRAVQQDIPAALGKLDVMHENVKELPALVFVVHTRRGQLLACSFQWAQAAESFITAVQVHQDVGRRATCPTLLYMAWLCTQRAGDQQKSAELIDAILEYKKEKKKWGWPDQVALTSAAVIKKKQGGEVSEESSPKEAKSEQEESNKWQHRYPNLQLYMRINFLYRGASFMTPPQFAEFMAMLQQETEACGADADGRCVGLSLQVEAMRQAEQWDEVVRLATEAESLQTKMTVDGKASSALHFAILSSAYAHYALGRMSAAKDALQRLDALGGKNMFAKQVEFKATHLRGLVGLELKETYTEIQVKNRSKARYVVDIPEGTEGVEWDWVLAEHTVSFEAHYTPGGQSMEQLLQCVEKHPAENGPFLGALEPAFSAPGRLVLAFDNSFSMLRGKTVHLRLQPSTLKAVRQDK